MIEGKHSCAADLTVPPEWPLPDTDPAQPLSASPRAMPGSFMRAFLFAVAVCCTFGVAVVADWAYQHAPVRPYGVGRPAGAWGTHACSRVGVRARGVAMSPVTREMHE
jgi:hypothetical protein